VQENQNPDRRKFFGETSARKLLDETSEMANPVEVGVHPQHGHGLFAVDRVAKGTLILSESPFFTLPGYQPTLPKDIPEPVTQLLMRLASNRGANHPKNNPDLQTVFLEYAFVFGGDASNPQTALFELASFINHSCTPNSMTFTGDDQKKNFVALDDIEAGDEITFSYILLDDGYNRQKHRDMLLSQRSNSFKCGCMLCQESSCEMIILRCPGNNCERSIKYVFAKNKPASMDQNKTKLCERCDQKPSIARLVQSLKLMDTIFEMEMHAQTGNIPPELICETPNFVRSAEELLGCSSQYTKLITRAHLDLVWPAERQPYMRNFLPASIMNPSKVCQSAQLFLLASMRRQNLIEFFVSCDNLVDTFANTSLQKKIYTLVARHLRPLESQLRRYDCKLETLEKILKCVKKTT
jgi:hypothetical protein